MFWIFERQALAAYMENLSVEFIMSNIFVYRVYDFAEQAACVKMLPDFLAKHPQVCFHFNPSFVAIIGRVCQL